MTKQEIINFLRDKKGYLKKSPELIQKRLEKISNKSISFNLVKECLKLVNSEQWLEDKYTNENETEQNDASTNESFTEHLEKNGLSVEDVKSVKFWQNARGEQRYSIVTMNQWHEMPALKKELIEDIKAYSCVAPKVKYKKCKDPVLYEISLPDIHYGKITDEDPKMIEKNYIKAIQDLHRKADGLDIERFLLPVGNDGLNSEGFSRSTTKGTPQQDSMRWRESFRGYWHLVCRAVEYLAQFAPVDVIVVQGNHDFERMFYAGEVLAAVFSNNKNVTVDNGLNSRKYYSYGDNLIMFTHGDKDKVTELALIVASEKPSLWGNSKFREVHCGHKHKESVAEYLGTKVRFIPSICANDNWHKTQGYVGTLRCGQAFIWNKTRGLEGFLQTNVVNYGTEEKN